jgi:ABC-2 type transport system ATP-binding protein
MVPIAIKTTNLKKDFVSRQGFWRRKTKTTHAVEDISFEVHQGELFGLLGPNGAGKTTTVKMLSTLLIPTSGSISILGLDILKETNQIRKKIGFTFGGARGLYGRLSAIDNLRYFAELYALPPSLTRKRIPELLEIVGLSGRGGDKVETYSSGMQQRLHLARALLHDPEIIYLDEPTVGIDPVGSREIRATIKELKERGKTILLTTHYMAEADELCDRIAIINHGKLVAMDSPHALKKLIQKESIIELKFNNMNMTLVKNEMNKLDKKTIVSITNGDSINSAEIRSPEPGKVIESLSPLLTARVVESLEVRNQTLEDVYVAIIQAENN